MNKVVDLYFEYFDFVDNKYLTASLLVRRTWMYTEAALLCQAFFSLSIFFQALMHRQNQILKNLYQWKVI